MIPEARSLLEINRKALRLLCKELGVVDAVRFLRQFTTGLDDYVEERDELFAKKSLEDMVREIKHGSD